MILALMITQAVVSLALVLIVLLQQGKQQGLSGAIAGGAETFFGKNKARTIDAKLKKFTTVMAALFIINSVALGFAMGDGGGADTTIPIDWDGDHDWDDMTQQPGPTGWSIADDGVTIVDGDGNATGMTAGEGGVVVYEDGTVSHDLFIMEDGSIWDMSSFADMIGEGITENHEHSNEEDHNGDEPQED